MRSTCCPQITLGWRALQIPQVACIIPCTYWPLSSPVPLSHSPCVFLQINYSHSEGCFRTCFWAKLGEDTESCAQGHISSDSNPEITAVEPVIFPTTSHSLSTSNQMHACLPTLRAFLTTKGPRGPQPLCCRKYGNDRHISRDFTCPVLC